MVFLGQKMALTRFDTYLFQKVTDFQYNLLLQTNLCAKKLAHTCMHTAADDIKQTACANVSRIEDGKNGTQINGSRLNESIVICCFFGWNFKKRCYTFFCWMALI